MPTEYTQLVAALKALTQGETPNTRTLLMAENGWNTRPDADSYGIVALDFETDALHGNDIKCATAYEGSVDLFSRKKHGDGYQLDIEQLLDEYFECSWRLNHYGWEPETGLFHWEWVFDTEE